MCIRTIIHNQCVASKQEMNMNLIITEFLNGKKSKQF